MLRFCCDWNVTEEHDTVSYWECDNCGETIILPREETPDFCGDD